jgi:hypothetical protein
MEFQFSKEFDEKMENVIEQQAEIISDKIVLMLEQLKVIPGGVPQIAVMQKA